MVVLKLDVKYRLVGALLAGGAAFFLLGNIRLPDEETIFRQLNQIKGNP